MCGRWYIPPEVPRRGEVVISCIEIPCILSLSPYQGVSVCNIKRTAVAYSKELERNAMLIAVRNDILSGLIYVNVRLLEVCFRNAYCQSCAWLSVHGVFSFEMLPDQERPCLIDTLRKKLALDRDSCEP